MAMKGFSKQLKELVANFTSESGEILDRPKSTVGRPMLVEERRVKFLRCFLDLLLHTKFISAESKYYIQNLYMTQPGVAKYFNTTEDNTQSKIWYDMQKVKKAFGEKAIIDIESYQKIDLVAYENRLTDIISKFADASEIFSRIALKMPEAKIQYSISEEVFDEFLSNVLPYSLMQMQEISSSLSSEPVGYIKYLMSSTLLNEEDKKRKERLRLLITGEQ